jgi:RNA polymerase sigma factor (TIGR02999 family)
MGTPASSNVTKLLVAWRAGNQDALNDLMPLVHRELRRLAKRYMAGERQAHTLQASALVNEAYLKLIDIQQIEWQNRAHFFAISAQLMRRILVDFARKRRFQKRGGDAQQITFHEEFQLSPNQTDLVAIDDALNALARIDSRKSQVVELRFFGGLTAEEAADVLQVSADTVLNDWKFAKAWLRRELTRGGNEKLR